MERPPQRREDAGSSRPALKVFSDLKTAEYGAPGHPEAPFRVRRTFELLKAAGLAPEKPLIAAGAAGADDVALLHGTDHLASVRTGDFSDPDTPSYPGIADVALISLSGALSAADKDDPIAGLRLDKATFRTIGALLAKTRLPRFAVLEGGYSEDLPRLVETFLDGFF